MVDYTITLGDNKNPPKIKMHLRRAGLIGRFKPLHLGGAALLEAACEQADELIIGIGSSNKYNARNPFTSDESEAMIRDFLAPKYHNFKIVQIPDFAHISEYANGKKWKDCLVTAFGKLDFFISGNAYVATLLSGTYRTVRSVDIIQPEKRIKLRASQVRLEIARYGDWKKYVPESVSKYLENNGLIDRFRNEFGLETLAQLSTKSNLSEIEDVDEEKLHTLEA